MSARLMIAMAGLAAIGVGAVGQAPPRPRLNPVIALLEQHKPVFGLYAPSNRRFGRGGAPAAEAPPPKPVIDLAKDALAYPSSDFVFDGSMEGGVDKALPAYAAFVAAMIDAGAAAKTPLLQHPLIVKTPKIAPDAAKAIDNISRELNTGVSGIMFVEAESAAEVRQGLAAMRFKSHGGTRPDAVGTAPVYWGLTDRQYREKADVWPLNPDGELINWTIVESREGLAHVKEIAAVKGIGVLWPGAGTLRGVFTSTTAAGERSFDAAGWEAAIQQVLAACKEFDVPCGYPATANDIEMRMMQGFSVFVMNWGDAGFKAIQIGRALAKRD
jgi:2-keto-3-deoxy-L-rhamnonate aldolase RhmA